MASHAPIREASDAGAWHVFTGNAACVPRGGAVLLPLEEWRSFPGLWAGHAGRIGLLLGPTDATDVVVSVLDGVDAIAAPGLDAASRDRLRAALEARGWRGAWLDSTRPAGVRPIDAEPVAA